MAALFSTATGSARVGKNRLRIVLVLTTTYLVAEAVAGVMTKSLALLADAGHMLTDAGALGLSLFAVSFAERKPTAERTFGYYRAEILAALANAVVLLVVSIFILYEAWQRFKSPSAVASWPMLVVAAIGMAINYVAMRLLAGSSAKSLNAKAAYLEVMSDFLGSIGVIAAAVIILTTGWYRADAVFGAAIGLFIVPRTWGLLKDAVHILMEGVPANIDIRLLEQAITELDGVIAAHDLHAWSLTSGIDAMSAHVKVGKTADQRAILKAIQSVAKERFGIEHSTIQLDEKECELPEGGF